MFSYFLLFSLCLLHETTIAASLPKNIQRSPLDENEAAILAPFENGSGPQQGLGEITKKRAVICPPLVYQRRRFEQVQVRYR